MNRQYCLLIYSKQSLMCKNLFNYIETLPFDLFATTGLSLCSVDNEQVKKVVQKNGITHVPTLLTKYFNQTQQVIQGDDIYNWIAAIADKMGYKENDGTETKEVQNEPDHDLGDTSDYVNNTDNNTPSTDPEDFSSKHVQLKQKGSVVAEALNMQKARDAEIGLNKSNPNNNFKQNS